MAKDQKRRRTVVADDADFDQIVGDVIRKGVVTAPRDPNGGGEVPVDQAGQARRKGSDGEQYMAVFDRNAGTSNKQLQEWQKYTEQGAQGAQGQPPEDEGAHDDADAAMDDDVYEPYSDDDGTEEPVEGTETKADDEFTHVRGHKRRKAKIEKSNRGDHDSEYAGESDDDDLDEDEDEDEDEKKERVAKAIAANLAEGMPLMDAISKAMKDEDDDEDDEPGEGDEGDEPDDEPDDEPGGRRRHRSDRTERREREVRKALGHDYAEVMDASEPLHTLTDGIYDLRDDVLAEIRKSVLPIFQENKALKARMAKLEQEMVANRRDMRSMAKSLTQGFVTVMNGAGTGPAADEPVRKGFGAPVASRPKYPARVTFDVDKALDTLSKAYENNDERLTIADITLLEGNRDPNGISPMAQQILREAGLNW